jgi:hypothetical protein
MAARKSGARTPEKMLPYCCFLVRCRLAEDDQPEWRFTVQQAGADGARHSFTSFDDLAAHMRAELASFGALAGDAAESEATSQERPLNGANVRRQKE